MRHKSLKRHNLPILTIVLCLTAFPWHSAHADATTEAQLRAALQQATQQIADLENQVANLQAQQAPDTAMINALQAQVQSLKQQAGQGSGSTVHTPTQSAADQKQFAALKRQLAAQQAELAKAETAYTQAASSASSNAASNAQLTAQLAALRTQNDSCEVKNAALFKIGNEILDQLAHRDTLWSGFSSVEPFVGIERVKLQNIVQGDQNALLDNQISQNGSGQ